MERVETVEESGESRRDEWTVRLFETERLHDRYESEGESEGEDGDGESEGGDGDLPARAIGRQLERAFTVAGIPHSVYYIEEPIETPVDSPQGAVCGEEVQKWWAENAPIDEGTHALSSTNMLLTDGEDGGCATTVTYQEQSYATVAARGLSRDELQAEFVHVGWPGFVLHAALHEAAHTAGYLHIEPTGWALNTSGWYHRTPATSNQALGIETHCGESANPIEGLPWVYHNYFTDCTAELFREKLELESESESESESGE